MKQNQRLTTPFVLALALLFAGGATPVVHGEPASDAALARQVPFKGASSGVVQLIRIDTQQGLGHFRVQGTGQATHLGRFTLTGDITVDLATGNAQGNWTLTAAAGDSLILSMAGHGIDPTHGFGSFTIVGGTGRFEGDAGYYEQIITFAVPIGTAEVITYADVFEGSILSGSN